MKLFLPLLTLVTALSLGCASGEKKADASDTREELNVASGKIGPGWSDRKNTFISQSNERVKVITTDLVKLDHDKNKLDNKQKNKATEAIHDTRSLLTDVREELADLKKVEAEEWEEERLEFLSKLNQLEERFTNAKNIIR